MKLCLLLASLAVFGAAAERPMIEGNEASNVRVLIYEDLQCPDCATFRRMLDDKLLPKYKATVAFEHRDFPLAKHSWARQAAITARFFYEQKAEIGLAFRRFALLNLKSITAENLKAKISEFAKAHGVDGAKAVASLDDARLAALVEKDFQDGVARGVAKTPTAFVNGAPFIETFTVEEISRAIDGELK
jgi:protein-disulfide isomerase